MSTYGYSDDIDGFVDEVIDDVAFDAFEEMDSRGYESLDYAPPARSVRRRQSVAMQDLFLIEEDEVDQAALSPQQNQLRRRFQDHIRNANRTLASNLSQACSGPNPLLTPSQCQAAAYAPAALYGRAVERLVARNVAADPILGQHLAYQGGQPGRHPDFRGRGQLSGINFEVTTSRARRDHVLRRYPNTRVYTYRRPKTLGF